MCWYDKILVTVVAYVIPEHGVLTLKHVGVM
jgi:hypothetical protein